MTKLERFKNGEKVALHTPTEEIANRLMQWCEDNGILWGSGGKTVENNNFHVYNQKTCYVNGFYGDKGLGYSPAKFYKKEGYYVLELTLADFKEDNKMFTKSDLRTGMVVELANDEKYIVLAGDLPTYHYDIQGIMFVGDGSRFMTGKSYNEEMICKDNNRYNIVAVYAPRVEGLECTFKGANESTLIWKRKPEVDWSKVAIDTKVLVKENEKHEWKRRYFAGVSKDGNPLAFYNGTTSFTKETACSCKEMVLYEGNEHLVGDDK